jgi:hypothetical protein
MKLRHMSDKCVAPIAPRPVESMVAPRRVDPHDDRDVVFSSAWRAKCDAFGAVQKPFVAVFAHASLAAIEVRVQLRKRIRSRRDLQPSHSECKECS